MTTVTQPLTVTEHNVAEHVHEIHILNSAIRETPILEVIAIEHRHRTPGGRCTKARTLYQGADTQQIRIHLFHDDQDRLHVVKLPSGEIKQ
jgi:hypothetical protein